MKNSSFSLLPSSVIVNLRIKNIRRPPAFDHGGDVLNHNSGDPLARVKCGASEVRC